MKYTLRSCNVDALGLTPIEDKTGQTLTMGVLMYLRHHFSNEEQTIINNWMLDADEQSTLACYVIFYGMRFIDAVESIIIDRELAA